MRIDVGLDTGHSTTFRSLALAVVAVVATGFIVSCASVRNPPGTVTAQFFQNPDRVWDALGLSLDALGYEVASSNRDEGVIRAKKPAGDTSGVGLEINQVMYTQDQVDVFVRGVAGEAASSPNQEDLDRAAQDFVTLLKRKLGN
jgi:uncharacterized lipoprotein